MKITEADRLAAREEREEGKRKMSPKAVARLREKAEDRLQCPLCYDLLAMSLACDPIPIRRDRQQHGSIYESK
jgi:hypothetical protein